MKRSTFFSLACFGLSTVVFRRKKALVGTIILTDKCNLECRHCSVNNITSVIYPHQQIRSEMLQLYQSGIRILFFCGGETFLWSDGDKTLRDLVVEAKQIGFLIVNVVTNGTFRLDVPEADLILLSLDGDREHHNDIRGQTYDAILQNIDEATSDNICFYMAINQINLHSIRSVCEVAKEKPNVRAVSFNFHTPYPDTEHLALSVDEKQACVDDISALIESGYPIFNLKSTLPYIVHNTFPVPCHQCVVMENGKLSTCGRCIDVPGLCERCGYFFAAEYVLASRGDVKVIRDMFKTYLRYL